MCQRLIPLADGSGLVLAADCFNLAEGTARAHLESCELDRLFRILRESGSTHNRALNGTLAWPCSQKKISLEAAFDAGPSTDELRGILEREKRAKIRPPPHRKAVERE